MKILAALILCLSLGAGMPAVIAAPARTVPLCGCSQPQATTAPTSFAAKPVVGTKATCTVMKQEFTVKADTQFSVYKGRYYAFCCGGCKPKFDKNPAQYARP